MKLTFNLGVGVALHFVCLFSFKANAQTPATRGIWLMPTLQFNVSDSAAINLQPGWNPQQGMFFIYANSVLKVNRLLDINLGYLFLDLPERNNDESTFMNGATLKLGSRKFMLENRNLIWNRFRTLKDSKHYDRNRARLFYHIKFDHYKISPYVVDEFWIYLNEIHLARNRVGAGVSLAVVDKLNLDFSYVRQSDRSGDKLHLFFLVLIKSLN
ncbi:DUF2490 domain-containing protein [Dyadobacter sp. CY351]|uniref:DUF2490 domain-containing protein n=1 Tax=Dyadobacter sp. CY351 TaxID=2909337 RepID=UPI001F2CC1D6|nr:DUF2490 domain-containing protein [Dyadobacter sp. CY351]MCF2518786.1 DUF2490 domain-containing protein [Dyadobacter sp. CY351]